jgi:arylformamidase
MTRTAKLIELGHPIETGMVTYPGLPAPVVAEHLSREASAARYAKGTTFSIGRVEMVANTGTYVDAPFHRFAEGRDIAAVPLDRLANLDGLVVDARSRGRRIGAEAFAGLKVSGRALLVHTGWDAHWRTPEYGAGAHPYLTGEAALHLAREGAALVGIDSLNIDDAADLERPAHSRLLEADVLIVEHLTNLGALPAEGFRFFAVPPPVRGMGSFPVRAFALVAG